MQTSLVPRLSYSLVFAKRLGPFYRVNETSVYLGIPVDSGGEGYPNERMSLRPFLVISVPSARVFECLLSEKCTGPGSKQRMRAQNAFFQLAWGPLPPLAVYLG